MFKSTGDPNLTNSPSSFRKRKSDKEKPSHPILSVDVLQGRRLLHKNTFCVVNFAGQEFITNIIWKNDHPIYNESFVLYVIC